MVLAWFSFIWILVVTRNTSLLWISLYKCLLIDSAIRPAGPPDPRMALPSRSERVSNCAGPLYKEMDRGARRERHYGPWGAWENLKKNWKFGSKKVWSTKVAEPWLFFVKSELPMVDYIWWDAKIWVPSIFFFDHFLSTIAKLVVK